MSTSSFFVSVFPSVDDFLVNRFFTEVASPASLRLPLASLWVVPSRLHALLVLHAGGGVRGSAAGGMSNAVDLVFSGVSTTARRFVLTSCARYASRVHNSLSVVGLCCVRSCSDATASDSFPLLRCFHEIVWENFR